MKVFTLFNEGKKRVERWVDRVAPRERASLKETLFRPFLPTTSVEPRTDTFIEYSAAPTANFNCRCAKLFANILLTIDIIFIY